MVDQVPIASRERRRAARVAIRLPLVVRFPETAAHLDEGVVAELMEASVDGCGVALTLAGSCQVLVGATVSILVGDGVYIAGIVISRMGMQARFRVGVRVHRESQALVQAVLRSSGVVTDC